MAKYKNLGGNTEIVKLADLLVDHSYQRDASPVWVNKIQERGEFDPSRVGTPTISRRADGSMYVVDGQHRTLLLIANGIETWECRILTGHTVEQEAELFYWLNYMRPPTLANRFRARVRCGGEPESTIKAICAEHGFRIPVCAGMRGREVDCLSALVYAHKHGNLGECLDIAMFAVPADSRILNFYLKATSLLLLNGAEPKRLREILRAKHPDMWAACARQAVVGGSTKNLIVAMAMAVARDYNVGKRTRRIPDMIRVPEGTHDGKND